MTSDTIGWTEVTLQLIRTTERAVCVTDGIQEIWLPLSQIEMAPAAVGASQDYVTISLPEWLAAEKGLL